MKSDLSQNHARAWRTLALASLVALLLARIPYLAAHEDLGRDMFIAWRLLRGEEFPLEGPLLAGTTHLGPIWYYVLAALQFIGRSWYGTMVGLGALASLQIPLAYLAGKELHSRRAGLLWAVGLIVPSWTTFEWMLPLHPTLTAPCVLAFLLCCLRFWRGGERRYFYGMALAFTLALHAHPSNLSLIWPGLFALLAADRSKLRRGDFLFAPMVVLLPLLPFLYADALRGFADLQHAQTYLGDRGSTGTPLALGALLPAIIGGGTRFYFVTVMGWSAQGASIATAALLLGGTFGIVGLVRILRDARTRRVGVCAIGVTALMLLTVACLRAMTPYYMTTAPRIMLAGLVALGLAGLGESRRAHVARVYAVAIAVLACVASLYGNARVEMRGSWPFAWLPTFDVKSAPTEIEPLLLTPAYAMGASGRFLCAQSAPSLHGTYASQVLHNYAMDMRMACARADVHLGGDEAQRSHWIGLSRAMFAQIGVQPMQRIGPIGLMPAHPHSAGPPVMVPDWAQYPVYQPRPQTPSMHRISVLMNGDERLAVSNVAFALVENPQVVVHVGDALLSALAHDRVASVYRCTGCAAGTRVDIDVTSGDIADVDIVTF